MAVPFWFSTSWATKSFRLSFKKVIARRILLWLLLTIEEGRQFTRWVWASAAIQQRRSITTQRNYSKSTWVPLRIRHLDLKLKSRTLGLMGLSVLSLTWRWKSQIGPRNSKTRQFSSTGKNFPYFKLRWSPVLTPKSLIWPSIGPLSTLHLTN